jgi:hypothetical protein
MPDGGNATTLGKRLNLAVMRSGIRMLFTILRKIGDLANLSANGIGIAVDYS